MENNEQTEHDGVVARRFDLVVGEETVPGIHWLPLEPAERHATVCIAHGGFQHKTHSNVPELAKQLVRNLGVGAVALDAPLHGDRATDPEATERLRAAIGRLADGAAMDPAVLAAVAERAELHVAEWRALLDALQADERWAAGPFGWWGLSMGTAHGLRLISGDRRIAAAVLGLYALRPGDEVVAAQAAAITVPVLFLNQADDELMTGQVARALFDAFGSTEKTMHINPGRHVEVPRFERDSSELFFRRHLLGGRSRR